MRTPKTVSCMTWTILAMRQEFHLHHPAPRLSRRLTQKMAIGPKTKATSDMHRLLDDHHHDQAEQRKQVADEGRDHECRRPSAPPGRYGHAGDQVGRGEGMVELDAVLEHAVIDLALALGDDAVAGAAQIKRLHIGRQALDDEYRRHGQRDQIDLVDVLGTTNSSVTSRMIQALAPVIAATISMAAMRCRSRTRACGRTP